MSAGISTLSSTRLIRLDRQAEEAEGKVVGQKIKANGQAALECSIFLCNTVNAVQQVQSSISTKYCRQWPLASMQTSDGRTKCCTTRSSVQQHWHKVLQTLATSRHAGTSDGRTKCCTISSVQQRWHKVLQTLATSRHADTSHERSDALYY